MPSSWNICFMERFLPQELFPFGLEVGGEAGGIGDIDHALGQKIGKRCNDSVCLLLFADFRNGVSVADVFQIGLVGMGLGGAVLVAVANDGVDAPLFGAFDKARRTRPSIRE